MQTLRSLSHSDLCHQVKGLRRNPAFNDLLLRPSAVFATSAFQNVKAPPCTISNEYAKIHQLKLSSSLHKSGFIRSISHDSNNTFDSSAWACRLANENGYLSWCRNAYLMTGVGVGMLYRGQTPMAELSGYGAMILAVISVSWGTYMFIYNLVVLRKRARVNMSWPFVLLQIGAAIFHCVCYVAICIVFADESDKILGNSRTIDVSEEEL